jgi:hypothetical protein
MQSTSYTSSQKKRVAHYCRLRAVGGKSTFNRLAGVSVPTEDGSQQSSTFTHAHKGPVPKFPIMSIKDQYQITHSYIC